MRKNMNMQEVSVQLVGGPTTIIEVGGLRFVTDPTFDPPSTYDVGGRSLTKNAPFPGAGIDWSS